MYNPMLERIAQLEESLRKMKNQYQMFFSGNIPLPPNEERRRFDRAMREIAGSRIRDNAVRFRFTNLMNNYVMVQERWGRQMREREEGPLQYQRRTKAFGENGRNRMPRRSEETPAPPPVTSPEGNSYVKVRDAADGDGIRALHEQISDARRQTGARELSLAQVSAMIDNQMETLHSRFGDSAVGFRVEIVDGKVKLKAKPLQGKE